jgi:hypothetical protein
MCSYLLQLLSETFLILRRIHRDIITNVRKSPCKVPKRNSFQILLKLEVSRHTFVNVLKYQISQKSGTLGVESFQTDRHDEANSRFSEFATASTDKRTSCFIPYISYRSSKGDS